MAAIKRKNTQCIEEENEKSLSDWKHRRGMLERQMTMKRTKAIEAIQNPSQEFHVDNKRLCRKHKMFGCSCQLHKERKFAIMNAT